MQGREEDSPAVAKNSAHRTPWTHSIFFIVLIAFLLRLAVITIGHTYRITPRRDHFQFGWEMGRIARSIALGQGFSSPTDLPTGPSAWAPPVYPYILAGVFKLFGIYSNLSAWVILTFNSIFSALTCLTLYRIAERIYGVAVARATAWTWALFPYAIYWPVRVVWEMSLSAFLLSLALLLTLRMADAPPRPRAWIGFGLLWGLLALTNTAVLVSAAGLPALSAMAFAAVVSPACRTGCMHSGRSAGGHSLAGPQLCRLRQVCFCSRQSSAGDAHRQQ